MNINNNSGFQINIKLSNLLEYVPSILIWLMMFSNKNVTTFHIISTLMWTIHFSRRTLEVLFVHSFSKSTILVFSIKDNSTFKNVSYYWLFSVLQSYFVLKTNISYISTLQYFGLFLFIISETLNSYCHFCLKNLRSNNSKEHFLPKGFFFNKIISPNYTFEILSWIGFSFFVQTLISILFPIVGGIQMYLWAGEKRVKLGEKYPEALKRGLILPFL